MAFSYVDILNTLIQTGQIVGVPPIQEPSVPPLVTPPFNPSLPTFDPGEEIAKRQVPEALINAGIFQPGTPNDPNAQLGQLLSPPPQGPTPKPGVGGRLLGALPEALAILASGLNPQAGQSALGALQAQRERQEREKERVRQKEEREESSRRNVGLQLATRGLERKEAFEEQLSREGRQEDASIRAEDRAFGRTKELKKIEQETEVAKAKVKGGYDLQVKGLEILEDRGKGILKTADDLINAGYDGNKAYDLAKKRAEGTLTPAESALYTKLKRQLWTELHPGARPKGKKGEDGVSTLVSPEKKLANQYKLIDKAVNDIATQGNVVVYWDPTANGGKGANKELQFSSGQIEEQRDLRGNVTGSRIRGIPGSKVSHILNPAERTQYAQRVGEQLKAAALSEYNNRKGGQAPSVKAPERITETPKPEKVATMEQVRKIAETKGVSEAQAKAALEAQGWTIK